LLCVLSMYGASRRRLRHRQRREVANSFLSQSAQDCAFAARRARRICDVSALWSACANVWEWHGRRSPNASYAKVPRRRAHEDSFQWQEDESEEDDVSECMSYLYRSEDTARAPVDVRTATAASMPSRHSRPERRGLDDDDASDTLTPPPIYGAWTSQETTPRPTSESTSRKDRVPQPVPPREAQTSSTSRPKPPLTNAQLWSLDGLDDEEPIAPPAAGPSASEGAGPEASKSAGSKAPKSAGSDASESAGSDASESAGLDASESAGSDESESAGSDASESAGSDASESAGSDESESNEHGTPPADLAQPVAEKRVKVSGGALPAVPGPPTSQPATTQTVAPLPTTGSNTNAARESSPSSRSRNVGLEEPARAFVPEKSADAGQEVPLKKLPAGLDAMSDIIMGRQSRRKAAVSTASATARDAAASAAKLRPPGEASDAPVHVPPLPPPPRTPPPPTSAPPPCSPSQARSHEPKVVDLASLGDGDRHLIAERSSAEEAERPPAKARLLARSPGKAPLSDYTTGMD